MPEPCRLLYQGCFLLFFWCFFLPTPSELKVRCLESPLHAAPAEQPGVECEAYTALSRQKPVTPPHWLDQDILLSRISREDMDFVKMCCV